MVQQDKQSTLPDTNISVKSIPPTIGAPSLSSDAITVSPLDNIHTINADNNRTIIPGSTSTNSAPPDTVLQNTNPAQPYTVLHDIQVPTPLEGPNNPIHDDSQSTTASLQNKNGYIHSSFLTRTSFPSHSISCYENLSSFSSHTSFEEKYVKNGFLKGDRCKARSTSATQVRPFLKTSTSFHTGLGEMFQKRSSLRNNISLSYFTSTFNIFMNKPNT